MGDCVFCNIAKKKEKADVVRETKKLLIIKDVNPQASLHLLIIPKKHHKDVTSVPDALWKEMKDVCVYLAREKGVKGFRLIHNAGDVAKIPHMQIHFLADIEPERAM